MRIFCIVVTLSLLANSIDVLAVTESNTTHAKKLFHANLKEKKSNKVGDVWERIRLGMKIPSQISIQQLSKPTLILERNSLTPKFAMRPIIFESGKKLDENILSGQPVASKYINPSNTTHTPINKYTALGLRLKFGTKPHSAQNDDCIPSISTVTLTEQSPKFKSYGTVNNENTQLTGLKPELRNRLFGVAPVNGNYQDASNKTGLLTTAGNNSVPCRKGTNKPVFGVSSTHAKQSEFVEINNAKNALINERINKQILLFSQSPSYLYQVTERSRPYLYHIVEGLSSNQLPLDLALLPIVESGYQPTALSPKGAAGIWQFIPSTGNDYDLKQSIHYDDRLDILASTSAAIRFLSDLQDHFNGDWLLALAAYNCGQGAVDKAISRNVTEGLETDYWSLRLPEETQDYVPRLLALSTIFANPETYGLKFSPIKNEPYFVKVKINREVDIKYLTDKKFAMLAKFSNLSHDQFSRLNPGFLNPAVSSEGAYTFLLPLANAEHLHRHLTSISQFMTVPVSLAINNENSKNETFPYAWDLSPNSAINKLISSSMLPKKIY
jgi:hypothetical protein